MLRWAASMEGGVGPAPAGTFRTGQRVLPSLKVVGQTPANLRLNFNSKTNLAYALEQCEQLEDGLWQEIVPPQSGTGASMEIDVPLPATPTAFWRVKAVSIAR